MSRMKIKKGDLVQVTSGRSQKNGGDRGKQGKVIAVYPDTQRVLVEGANRIKKHTKVTQSARGSQQGGIIDTEMFIDISNVQVVCRSCGKPTRVGHRIEQDGTKVRVCRKCGEDL